VTKRRTLKTYGERGRSARVFVERGGQMVRVQWRMNGRLKTESFPNSTAGKSDAKDFAQGVVENLEARHAPKRITVADLWSRYSLAEVGNLRAKTFALNADAWRKWELFVGREKIAEDLGADSMAGLRAELEKKHGLAVNTIRRVVGGIKTVYGWGEAHEILARNKMHRYRFKVGKDKKPAKVAEYRKEDFTKLCEALPLDKGRNWRAGAIIRICGYQGVRQGAVRHLQWTDVDFMGRTITWRSQWDKLGRTWRQPMREATADTLVIIRSHQGDEPWVFPAPRERKRSTDPVYSAQALWWALTQAEKRAGIEHKANRGAHGLRRMLAGDIMALTGNLKTAGDAIGDKDLRVLQEHYLRTREDQVREAFAKLDEPESVTPTVIPEDRERDAVEAQASIYGHGKGLLNLGDDAPGGTRTHDLTPQASRETTAVPGNPPMEEGADAPHSPPKPPQNRNRNRNGTVTSRGRK